MAKKEKEEKPQEDKHVTPTEITGELRDSYLDYAMSVIVSRALPDVRDGLKPVQRRILWSMWDSGVSSDAKFRKSADVTGEVMGKYHPHGDQSIYQTIVRMVQDFTFRYPLCLGQGNWGSIDGDEAAAMRYSETKLSKIAESYLTDIEKETVDWQPNYSNTKEEPKYLPTKLPTLLLNGTAGIAVGMATNIPPHNLNEVVDATLHLSDNPKASTEDLLEFIKGPDFPTGGIIFNKRDIKEAYTTGKGGIVMRGVAEIKEMTSSGKQKYTIEISEIPYQVNKSELIAKMALLVQDKKIDGIKDIQDHSAKEMSIVIELKPDANPQKILNQLYTYTDLQKKFNLNMVALTENGLQPEIMSLKDILEAFIDHRKLVVTRRAKYELKKAEERAHVLEGLSKALKSIDKIIATIKKSKDRDEAKKNLITKFKLSEIQANAILEMKLSTLAALERKKIEDELAEKKKLIKELKELLGNPKKILAVLKDELKEVQKQFGDERRTRVIAGGIQKFEQEDLIPKEEAIITLSQGGYIKRLSPKSFKTQHRGGKGLIGSNVADEDFLRQIIYTNTHDNILFFTDKGRVHQTKVYEIPLASRTAKGKPVHNFLEIPTDVTVKAVVTYPNSTKELAGCHLAMATKNGLVKKTPLEDFQNIRKNGIVAISLKKDDMLKWVGLSCGKDEIILTSTKGQSIRFKENQVRAMGRTAAGVKGIKLRKDDDVSSMNIIKTEDAKSANLLVVMSNGYGKQTPLTQYKVQSRGGSGVKTAKITSKTGELMDARIISETKELIALSAKGQIIRTDIASIRKAGRDTQGVRIMNVAKSDKLISIICF
ncbi:MAG: DNA gyrase subunit A [bacterium]|nr:DNA gyrase subunit A [bacterium]